MVGGRIRVARKVEGLPDLGRAVEPGHIVGALHLYGLSQRDIARAVGVSDRTIRAWVTGTAAADTHYRRLIGLRKGVLILRDELTPSGVGHWFRASNRLLHDARPLDVMAGDPAAVLLAASAFAEGAFV